MSRTEEFHEGRQTVRRSAVIFDMDGTLADVSSIRHHVAGPKKDFDTFHRESVNVPPNADVVKMAHEAKSAGHDVIVVTARKAKYRNHTATWLGLHEVPSDAMYMRSDKDNRPDAEVKQDILNRVSRSWDVVHAVDDNPNVLKVWEKNGIRTTRVPGWQGGQ